jgi:hypothetical protein
METLKIVLSPFMKKMYVILLSFNKLHTYSMVCYPVGTYADHFKDSNESLENKLLMSIDINIGKQKN